MVYITTPPVNPSNDEVVVEDRTFSSKCHNAASTIGVIVSEVVTKSPTWGMVWRAYINVQDPERVSSRIPVVCWWSEDKKLILQVNILKS